MKFAAVIRTSSLALAILASSAAASAQAITVWHAYRGTEKTAFEKVVSRYNESKKGTITVSLVAVPYDAMADRITGAVPRGKGPDVFIYAQDRLGGWAEQGNTIAPLLDVPKATLDRFLPATLQAVTYQGKPYGLPLSFKVVTLIYNKKLVPQPPKTSTELIALARQHTDVKAGRYGLAYWYSNFYFHSALLNSFVKQAGGGVFNAYRKPTISSAENQKSLELLLRWMDLGVLPPDPSSALVKALFNEGKAAMVFEGPWFLGEISPSISYGLALLPTLDEAAGTAMKPWATIEGVYVTAPSTNKAAARDFIEYVTADDAATILALEGRQTPANKRVYSLPQIAADPVLKHFRQQLERSIPMPNVPEMSMVWAPVTTAMNQITKKTATPADAMKTAQSEVEAAIAEWKKK